MSMTDLAVTKSVENVMEKFATLGSLLRDGKPVTIWFFWYYLAEKSCIPGCSFCGSYDSLFHAGRFLPPIEGIRARWNHVQTKHPDEKLDAVAVAWIFGVNYRSLKSAHWQLPQPDSSNPKRLWTVAQIQPVFEARTDLEEREEAEALMWRRVKQEITQERIEFQTALAHLLGVRENQCHSALVPEEELVEFLRVKIKTVLENIITENFHFNDVYTLSREEIDTLELLQLHPYDLWDEELGFIVDWEELWGTATQRDAYQAAITKSLAIMTHEEEEEEEEEEEFERCEDCTSIFCAHECYFDSDDYEDVKAVVQWFVKVARFKKLGAFVGEPQTGKSSIVNLFLHYNYKPDSLKITVGADTNHSELVEQLSYEIAARNKFLIMDQSGRYPFPKQLADQRRILCNAVSLGYLKFIVIDNAEYLKPNALQEVRSLHNILTIPILLVGDTDLFEHLKKAKLDERTLLYDLEDDLVDSLNKLKTIPFFVGEIVEA